MTVAQLPGEIATATRDDIVRKWKRSHELRVPEADTGDGSQPDTDARVAADMLMPLYAAAKIAGQNAVLEESRGDALKQWGKREGVGAPNEARGATGYVTVKASSGGGTILAGTEARSEASLRYRVVVSDHYDNGDPCGVVGVDTGPLTNLEPGTQLKWTSPPPGIADTCLVLATAGGQGLAGGSDIENEDEYRGRIEQEKQNRAASGNDAEYQLEAEATPEVAVQKAFTVPGVLGPGTIAVGVTVQPAHPGGSRAPTSLQLSLVEGHVTGEFPADDGSVFYLLVEEPADVSYQITWADGAAGWMDVVQWPPFHDVAPVSGPGAIRVSAAASATVFTLATANASYTGVRQPVIGQTIGFYDAANFVFVRKRILSFTGTGPWVITCDTTNNASDTGYTPPVGQRAMPWSNSLDEILYTAGQEANGAQEAVPASGVLAYFDTLGPGEQFASFYDEGLRRRRSPKPPKFWPHTLTTRGLIDAVTAESVEDVDVFEGDGAAPSVGVPGVYSNILKLRYLACFPEV